MERVVSEVEEARCLNILGKLLPRLAAGDELTLHVREDGTLAMSTKGSLEDVSRRLFREEMEQRFERFVDGS